MHPASRIGQTLLLLCVLLAPARILATGDPCREGGSLFDDLINETLHKYGASKVAAPQALYTRPPIEQEVAELRDKLKALEADPKSTPLQKAYARRDIRALEEEIAAKEARAKAAAPAQAPAPQRTLSQSEFDAILSRPVRALDGEPVVITRGPSRPIPNDQEDEVMQELLGLRKQASSRLGEPAFLERGDGGYHQGFLVTEPNGRKSFHAIEYSEDGRVSIVELGYGRGNVITGASAAGKAARDRYILDNADKVLAAVRRLDDSPENRKFAAVIMKDLERVMDGYVERIAHEAVNNPYKNELKALQRQYDDYTRKPGNTFLDPPAQKMMDEIVRMRFATERYGDADKLLLQSFIDDIRPGQVRLTPGQEQQRKEIEALLARHKVMTTREETELIDRFRKAAGAPDANKTKRMNEIEYRLRGDGFSRVRTPALADARKAFQGHLSSDIQSLEEIAKTAPADLTGAHRQTVRAFVLRWTKDPAVYQEAIKDPTRKFYLERFKLIEEYWDLRLR